MKIRINQDVTFNWKLTVEGEPVDLSKLELSVEITTPSNKKVEITPNIQFDTLEFNYRPKQVGEYILSAYLNRFKDGETALDIKAFEGVKYSWNQDFSTNNNLEANYVELEGNFGPKSVTYLKITYADLVNLRDTSKLTSGIFYRITDYITTTTQTGTKSAGNPFDVVVLALSERELSEQAWAIQHDGDTYFANNDLSAWKIWYCLDNDTTRFEWADETNGKGVIYRMIDEFNNDIPYDFKNIQFKHPNDTTSTYPYYYYTFASDNVENNTDYSIDIANNCYSNTIMEYIDGNKIRLNCIIFIGGGCFNNYFSQCCYENTFRHGCFGNIFCKDCHRNKFGGGCTNNTFGNGCFSNIFGNNCSNNKLDSSCYKNTFGQTCFSNVLGYYCTDNILRDNSKNTTLGAHCNNIYLGESCEYNYFGNGCSYINFSSIISPDFKYRYYANTHFGEGCKYILFKGAETASSAYKVQNYNFAQGLQGTSDTYLTVDGKRGRSYETKVAKNSNGELKIYCEADLIQ